MNTWAGRYIKWAHKNFLVTLSQNIASVFLICKMEIMQAGLPKSVTEHPSSCLCTGWYFRKATLLSCVPDLNLFSGLQMLLWFSLNPENGLNIMRYGCFHLDFHFQLLSFLLFHSSDRRLQFNSLDALLCLVSNRAFCTCSFIPWRWYFPKHTPHSFSYVWFHIFFF